MTFADVQSYLQARFAAVSALASLGPTGGPVARLYDPLQEDEAQKTDIANRIAAKGVAFEIGFPEFHGPETLLSGSSEGRAFCMVAVAESPKVAHTPSGSALVQLVISALTAKPIPTQKPARIIASERPLLLGNGNVVHLFGAFIELTIRPQVVTS